MKEPIYLDITKIRGFSLKLINLKEIIKRKYILFKNYIEHKYEHFKYSLRYTNLVKRVAKENDLKINRNARYFKDVIINNDLQDVKNKNIISVMDSYLKFSVKLQGIDINSICRTTYEKPEETERGFLVTRYSHDKGYSFINHIKFYNLDGIYFKLDLYSIDEKITEIIDIYYQESFDSIVIVGKKLTYGENVKNSYIIKVFTKSHKLKNWYEFVEIKTGDYRNDVKQFTDKYSEYKKNVKMFLGSFNNTNPNLICIDTIDVSKLLSFKDVKDVDISIGSRGIDIVERKDKSKMDHRFSFQLHDKDGDEVFLNKKYINIHYFYDERVVEDKTRYVDDVFKSDLAILHPGSKLTLNHFSNLNSLNHRRMDIINNPHFIDDVASNTELTNKKIDDLTEEVKFLKEEIILVADPKLRLAKKVKGLIEKIQKDKLLSMNLFNKKDVSLHPLVTGISDSPRSIMFGKYLNNEGFTNNNYNREFIPFDRNYVKRKK